MSEKIECGCCSTYLFQNQEKHFNSKKHQKWFLSDPENNINKIFILCGCGEKYNFQTQYNHFKSKKHKLWEEQDPTRYMNVLIICSNGNIVRYKNHRKNTKKCPFYNKK